MIVLIQNISKNLRFGKCWLGDVENILFKKCPPLKLKSKSTKIPVDKGVDNPESYQQWIL